MCRVTKEESGVSNHIYVAESARVRLMKSMNLTTILKFVLVYFVKTGVQIPSDSNRSIITLNVAHMTKHRQ